MAALDAAVEHGARVQRDQEFGQGALFGGGADESRGRTARAPLARRAGVERHRAAQRREGSPRPVLDRPSRSTRTRRTCASSAPAPSPSFRTTSEDDERRLPSDEGRAAPAPPRGTERRGRHRRRHRLRLRPLKTRKGDPMAVFTLEDPHGSVEVVVFPEAVQAGANADRGRRAGPGAGKAGTRRRDAADPGVGDAGARRRARAPRARARDHRQRAAARARDVRGAGGVCSLTTGATSRSPSSSC